MKGRGKGRHSPAAPGRRAAQNIRKSNDAGPNNKNKNGPVSKHKVFVGNIGDLTEEELRILFSQYGDVVSVSPVSKERSFCFVTFQSTEVVQALLQQRFVATATRQLRIRAYTHAPEDSLYRYLQDAKEEALLETLETGPKAPKTLTITDSREDRILSPGESAKWEVLVHNRGSQARVLYGVDCVPASRDLSVFDNIRRGSSKFAKSDGCLELPASRSHQVKLVFKPEPPFRYGILRWLLVVRGRNLNISHPLKLVVANKEELELLKPDSEYRPKESLVDDIERIIVPAFPPSRASKTHLHTAVETAWVEPLERYDIPEDLQKDIDSRSQYGKFDPWLVKDNYRKRLHTLLWIEEAEQKVNMRRYDIANAKLEPVFSYTVNDIEHYPNDDDPIARLFVPGLAEKRPSVLSGDIVYAWIPGTTDYEYEGYVHATEQQHVLVMFCKDFHRLLTDPTRVFHIRFSFDRMFMRLMHRAVAKCDISLVWPERPPRARVIGDSKLGKSPAVDMKNIQWFDPLVSKNKEQAAAVLHLVNKKQDPEDGSAPILMFGAFGTGKTRTLVEAIKLLLIHDEESTRILVCAPSNSAADVFVEKLSYSLTPTELFRLNAFHRKGVPAVIQNYSYYVEDSEVYNIPPLEVLLTYRVIVSTGHTSGNLFGVGVRKGHFTHIVLDEAAQMMEAEALIPLSVADNRCVIIMAGDVKQLGPHVQSPSCRVHGLGKSIMERIADLPVYAHNNNLCFELTKNYRSHPSLLEFCSTEFYGGKLKCNANREVVDSLCGWKKLPNPAFPFVFFGIEGQDMREGDSPSFFNPFEVMHIADLICDLVADKKLRASEVGVITPYYKQNYKVRKLLRQKGLGAVMVGSIQEMQGKERKAIFISTVRSSNHWKEHDRVHELGFLSNPRRLNTALTRAQALLVVVGDPYVLYNDSDWRELIQYCLKNNSYVGPELRKEYFEERKEKESKEVVKAPIVGANAVVDANLGLVDEAPDEEEEDKPIEREKVRDGASGSVPKKPLQLEEVWSINKPKLAREAVPPSGQLPKPTATESKEKAKPTLKASFIPYYPKETSTAGTLASSPKAETAPGQTQPPHPSKQIRQTANVATTPLSPDQFPALPVQQKPIDNALPRPLARSNPQPAKVPHVPPPRQQVKGTPAVEQPTPLHAPYGMGSPGPQVHHGMPPHAPMATGPPVNQSSSLPAMDPNLAQYIMQMQMHIQFLQQQINGLSHLIPSAAPLELAERQQPRAFILPNGIEPFPVEGGDQPLPQVYPAQHPVNLLPPDSEKEEYLCVCTRRETGLISVRTALSCPPMTVFEEEGLLEIHIPLFGLQWKMRQQGSLVYIALYAYHEQLKRALFHVSVLHNPQNLSGNEKTKERIKNNAQLLIAVPFEFDAQTVTVEERVKEGLLVVAMRTYSEHEEETAVSTTPAPPSAVPLARLPTLAPPETAAGPTVKQ